MTDKMQQILSQAAVKGGPWAVIAIILMAWIYQFMLVPMEKSRISQEKERTILISILQKNVNENRRVMAKISEHMEQIVIINKDTKRVLENFTASVSGDDHPEQTRKLDRIIDLLKK